MAVSRCEGDCAAITRKAMRVLRTTLKATGIHDSWTSLRNTLEVQRRVRTRLRRADGQTTHVQKNAGGASIDDDLQSAGDHSAPGWRQQPARLTRRKRAEKRRKTPINAKPLIFEDIFRIKHRRRQAEEFAPSACPKPIGAIDLRVRQTLRSGSHEFVIGNANTTQQSLGFVI